MMDLLGAVRNLFSLLWGVLGYVLRFLRLLVLPKAVLVSKLMALETQLASCLDAVNRKKAPKPSFGRAFRWLRTFVVVFTPTTTMAEPERKAVGAESPEVSTTCVVRGGGVEHPPPPRIKDLRTAPVDRLLSRSLDRPGIVMEIETGGPSQRTGIEKALSGLMDSIHLSVLDARKTLPAEEPRWQA